jgi:O-antigen/teichoic acid export membrane protein
MLPTLRCLDALRYLRFGAVVVFDGMLWLWYTSIDTLLLGRWAGAASLGFYRVAQQLANMPLEKISTIVNQVALPAYAELRGDRRGIARLTLETMRTHAVVGFPIFWGLAAVADSAVPVLFGSKWQAAVFPLIAFSAVAPLKLIGSIESPAMTGTGHPGILLKTKWILVPGMTAALAAGCWLGGINGAALSWLLAFPICYSLAFRYVLEKVGLTYREMLVALRGPAIVAALMVVLVRLGSSAAAEINLAPALGLLAQIAIGALSYALLLRVIDRDAFQLTQQRMERLIGWRRGGAHENPPRSVNE